MIMKSPPLLPLRFLPLHLVLLVILLLVSCIWPSQSFTLPLPTLPSLPSIQRQLNIRSNVLRTHYSIGIHSPYSSPSSIRSSHSAGVNGLSASREGIASDSNDSKDRESSIGFKIRKALRRFQIPPSVPIYTLYYSFSLL